MRVRLVSYFSPIPKLARPAVSHIHPFYFLKFASKFYCSFGFFEISVPFRGRSLRRRQLKSMARRYNSSLRFSRRLQLPHKYRSLNLWSKLRWDKGKHHLQNQAKPPLFPPLRPKTCPHLCHWHERAKEDQTRCLRG